MRVCRVRSELLPAYGFSALFVLKGLPDLGQKCFCLRVDFAAGPDQFHEGEKAIISFISGFPVRKSRRAAPNTEVEKLPMEASTHVPDNLQSLPPILRLTMEGELPFGMT
jgi:hypothetical protein